jgi:FdrA protein
VIQKARDLAANAGRHLAIMGFVCGTAADPQNLSKQEATLREVGVTLAESNAQVVRMAASVVQKAGGVGGQL